jgi:hypothetical protein
MYTSAAAQAANANRTVQTKTVFIIFALGDLVWIILDAKAEYRTFARRGEAEQM